MIWTLNDLFRSATEVQYEKKEKWYPARPENWKYRSFWQKCKEAWAVFTGKAEAFVWPENQ